MSLELELERVVGVGVHGVFFGGCSDCSVTNLAHRLGKRLVYHISIHPQLRVPSRLQRSSGDISSLAFTFIYCMGVSVSDQNVAILVSLNYTWHQGYARIRTIRSQPFYYGCSQKVSGSGLAYRQTLCGWLPVISSNLVLALLYGSYNVEQP